MAGCFLLPMCGGLISSPARDSDQAVQSSHHEPGCLVPERRHASGSGKAAVSSPVASCQAFGPGGLTMPAMCPPLDSTYLTLPPISPQVL